MKTRIIVVQFSVRGSREACLLRNVQRASVSTKPRMQHVARLNVQWSSGRGVNITTHLCLEPRLRVDLYLRFLHKISWLVCGFFLFLWHFDLIPVHGLPLRDFAITLRHTTYCRTPLDEWPAQRRVLRQHTILSRYRHPWPRRDSNPQS